MGIAGAAGAGSALRLWGSAIGGAVDEFARGMRGSSPRAVAATVADMVPVSRDAVRATGWEVRHAMAWRNDDFCFERAVFTALSLLEREAGSLRSAVGELATMDARRAAIAVNYSPNFASATIGRARLHAAPVFRTAEGEAVVIDHLFADAEDGVMSLADWMRRSGGSDDTTRIIGVLQAPPLSLRGGAGIPVSARPLDSGALRRFGDNLARAWETAAAHGQPAYQPLRR